MYADRDFEAAEHPLRGAHAAYEAVRRLLEDSVLADSVYSFNHSARVFIPSASALTGELAETP